MKKASVREDWRKFLLDEDQNYTFLEATDILKRSVFYLKEKGIRITEKMLILPKMASQEYYLTDTDKAIYMAKFEHERYDIDSCKKLLEVMDAVYHYFDLTKDKSAEFVLYVAENKLKLSDALNQKYGFAVEEIDEYINYILQGNAKYCAKKSSEYGKELLEILSEVFEQL